MIKTISLTANQETAVKIEGGSYCLIENRGTSVVYASKFPNVVASEDNVIAIDLASAKILENATKLSDSGVMQGTIYLVTDSDGAVEVRTAMTTDPFKSKQKGGGESSGGGVTDTYSKAVIDAKLSKKADEDVVNQALDNKVDKDGNKVLSDNNFSSDEKEKLANLVNYDDTQVKTDIINLQTSKANADDVYTIAQANSAIATEVAKIVAEAPESLDTLQEISMWIDTHEDSASAMNLQIQTNKTNIAKKVDKKDGYSLVSDTEITRLAEVDNYDDTQVKTDIAELQTNGLLQGEKLVYVDAINGSDDNDGSSSAKLKTLKMAIAVTRNYQKSFIRLSDGEYELNDTWYIYNQEVHIAGASVDGTIVKVAKQIHADNSYVDFSKISLDTTVSNNDNPVVFYYNAFARLNDMIVRTNKHTALRGVYEVNMLLKNVNMIGATMHSVANVYHSTTTIINCTADAPVKTHEGSVLSMWDSEIEYDTSDGLSIVIVDGKRVYPINDTQIKNDIALNLSSIGMSKKNLLNFNGYSVTTPAGITYTVNSNGSVTAKGISTGTSYYKLARYFNVGETVILTGNPTGGYSYIEVNNKSTSYKRQVNEPLVFDCSSDTLIQIVIPSGKTLPDEGITFYPMIRYADITDDTYEPYTPSLQEQINDIVARLTALEG